jgi:flagellar protein FliS
MRTSKGDLSNGISAYQQFGVRTEIESASPHKLIQMLINGALAKIRVARTCTEHEDIVGKCENIDWAIAIIGGLRGSLNLDGGGVIAQNLDGLYEYTCRQLALANVRNDVELLDEVIGLLGEIKAGWDGIEPELDEDNVAAAY